MTAHIRSDSWTWFPLLVLFALACSGDPETEPAAPAAAEEASPQNIILITLDTVRSDALGAYGQPRPSSPNLDAMASTGALFERVASAAPSTLPSHATLFTSKFPFSHGVRANAGYRLPLENETLAEILQANGFATDGEVAAPVLSRSKRLDQGFDRYNEPASELNPVYALDEATDHRDQQMRAADEITSAGVSFLRKNKNRPFFLWLHYFDAHRPYDPPQRFRNLLSEDHLYLAEIRRIDDQLGRLRDEIVRLGLRDRTLVVITADHGDSNGEHGETSHSFFVYDSTMRIPLILWGAGIPRGVRVPSLVRSVDVAPTILDLLGLPPMADVQGTSLRPLLESPGEDLELTGYGETIEPLAALDGDVLRFSQIDKWKYIHKVEPELFDVEADPGELNNLASRYPKLVSNLRSRLAEILANSSQIREDAVTELTEAEREQLMALGYAAADAPEKLSGGVESLELSGPDPTGQIAAFEAVSFAWGALMRDKPEEAKAAFSELYAGNTESRRVLQGLIASLIRLEQDEELIPMLKKAIELDPESVRYRFVLAQKVADSGDKVESERLYRELLELDPCHQGGRLLFSEFLREATRYREQAELLGSYPERCRSSEMLDNALAYALATSPDDASRDGARALRMAKKLVAEADGERPDLLDTLACAHAELGDFDKALAVQRRATTLLEAYVLPDEVLAPIRRNLAAFEAGRPVRER